MKRLTGVILVLVLLALVVSCTQDVKMNVIGNDGKITQVSQPSGTYKANIMRYEYSVKFSPGADIGTLVIRDQEGGEDKYEYRIMSDLKHIFVRHKNTGMAVQWNYKYDTKNDTVFLDGVLYSK